MNLHNLTPAEGSVKNAKKRLGRGQGSGKGGTATRGTKGAQARAGYEHKIGFEGGQMPIQRRLPKFGFKNPTRVEFHPVNVSDLQALADATGITTITIDLLVEAGLASPKDLVKVLGNGELTAKLEVSADAFSKSAIAKIEAAGGSATIVEE
ncbi:MAG: 50S ribosomal protein L15 [Bacteroidales bacterium]|nr:50S ribosomal protein L15 [Bacteroidales bacterium]